VLRDIANTYRTLGERCDLKRARGARCLDVFSDALGFEAARAVLFVVLHRRLAAILAKEV